MNGHLLIERRIFRQITETTARFDGMVGDVHPVDEGMARRWGDESRHHAHGRGFSRAVRAEKAQNLPGLDVEGNIVDGEPCAK